MRDLTTIETRNARMRIVLIALVAVALVLGWFGVRWQLGSMLANLTPTDSPEASSIADVAIDLAPSDPVASWLRASVDGASDISLYENAARLSP